MAIWRILKMASNYARWMDVVHGHKKIAGDSSVYLSMNMDGAMESFFFVERRAASMCIDAAAPNHKELRVLGTVLMTRDIL